LCTFALVLACVSCGDDRSRSARGNTADRERVLETLGARLAQVIASPDRIVPLREVFASRSIVGRRVRVVGRCAPRLGLPDPPARSGEEWQLQADGLTVVVVGHRPRSCLAAESKMLMLTVVVAEDTLAAIGDLPSTPRRYLILVAAR
jgi:hypothetical protein